MTTFDLKFASARLMEVLNDTDLGATGNAQLMAATMDLAQAQACRAQATDYLAQIDSIQDEQARTGEMIAAARKLQSDALASGGAVGMPADMVSFFKEHCLSLTQGKAEKLTKPEWDACIQTLTEYREAVSGRTQDLMIRLQDFIAQYDSYTRDAGGRIAARTSSGNIN